MRWTVNPALKQRLLSNLCERYSRERRGVHVSDLVLCIRQAWFKRIAPKPPTEVQLGWYVDGASRHAILQDLYGGGVKEKRGVDEYGIHYCIDILDDGVPVELKTTRAPRGRPGHYEKQIVLYMLQTGSRIGRLIIQRLMPPRSGEVFEAYDVEFESSVEREVFNGLRRSAWALQQDIASHVLTLPRHPAYPSRFPCVGCLWREECGGIG